MQELSLITALSQGNLILASANVVIAFSLLVYLLTHNFRNAVARSFCALLTFVTVVYVGDVLLTTVASLESAVFWLKFQWLGIAFVPAAYLHFSDALLRTTNASSRLRRNAFRASYFVSLLFLLAVVFTDWLVWDGVYSPWAVHFKAGPLFWIFAVYFFLASAWGAVNVRRTCRRCLTSTSRRRMTYVTVSVAAPLSVFPYLLVASLLSPLSANPLLFLALVAAANVGIALMTVVMAYGVAYHGVLMPDRVVKRSLIRYLIQGPLLGICVIGLMLLVPQVERILGLPRDTVLIFAVVIGIVLFQILITLIQPLIDLMVYQGDRGEVTWLRRLDERLLTSTDLRQLLENILTAICDLLRVKTGFVMVMRDGQLHIDTLCGSRAAALSVLRSFDPAALTAINAANGHIAQDGEFVQKDGFWLLPLRARGEDATLGILGVETRAEPSGLTEEERELIGALVERAETALEDRRLQQGVFGLLKQITPEIESLQRWRGIMPHRGTPALEPIEDNPVYSPDFAQWVKDALAHYWGGPRLTESPLLRLRVVREALRQHDYNPAKAMRAVLERAIETLKPAGERSLTASDWVLYNILELRFIKGQKVKEIAPRLAMSESDLYRKQRVAIEEVARQLANMEEQGAK
jgi:hypothetical protein